MATSNERFELLDLHQGLLCRVRTNNSPVRCGATAEYIYHSDVTGPKVTRHYASPVCLAHAQKFAEACGGTLLFPRGGIPVMSYGSRVEPIDLYESGVMTGAQAVAAMTGNHKSTSESLAQELVMFIKQQEALARQIEVGIERCRTMLRILKESNERKYQ